MFSKTWRGTLLSVRWEFVNLAPNKKLYNGIFFVFFLIGYCAAFTIVLLLELEAPIGWRL